MAPEAMPWWHTAIGALTQLIAVTDNVNQAKGDQDPASWSPPLQSYRCTYAKMWVRTKDNYDLTVQQSEKDALTAMLGTC